MSRGFRTLVGLCAASIPASIYLFYVGVLDSEYILPAAIAITATILLVYFHGSHEFRDGDHRSFVYGGLSLALGGSVLWALAQFSRSLTAPAPSRGVSVPAVPDAFLPRWWLLVFLAPATLALVVASFRIEEFPEYTTPGTVERLPETPVYFGGVAGFVGFWGVLFVGLGVVHRIVVVAPLFEELLKFGVALLFAAAIFGRSLLARYAVAVIVGVVFGSVEHVVTYPAEHDLSYVFRVVFHVVTTGLTVSVYTVFEEHGENRLMWVAPSLSILFHFAHNTFAVVAGLVLYAAAEGVRTGVQLFFGFVVIVAVVLTTGLVIKRLPLMFAFHEWVSSFSPTHEA